MNRYLEEEAKQLEGKWTGEWPWQEDIKCNYCKKHICFAYTFDTEGTHFYCDDCFAHRAEIAKEIREKNK